MLLVFQDTLQTWRRASGSYQALHTWHPLPPSFVSGHRPSQTLAAPCKDTADALPVCLHTWLPILECNALLWHTITIPLHPIPPCWDKHLLTRAHSPFLYHFSRSWKRFVCMWVCLLDPEPLESWAQDLLAVAWYLVGAWHLVDTQQSLQRWTNWCGVGSVYKQTYFRNSPLFSVVHWFGNMLFIICYGRWKRGNLAQNSGLGVWPSEIGNCAADENSINMENAHLIKGG